MFKEDIECLKYVFKHGGIGGSIIRLARMCRMMYFITILIVLFILIYRFTL